jgi:SLT domain-containing protein
MSQLEDRKLSDTHFSLLLQALNLFIRAMDSIRAGLSNAMASLDAVQAKIDEIDAVANMEAYLNARGLSW